MRAVVLLNADAGTMRSLADKQTVHTVRERFAAGGWNAQVSLVPSGALGIVLSAAVTSSADAIVVGGGDGSVSRAVATVAGSAKALGVLPLGTVNLLGRDLGMSSDLGGAIDSLCGGETRAIDLATLNGRPFHSLSGLGFFAHMARERERMRRRWRLPRRIAFALAAARAFARMGTLRLEIEADGAVRPVTATALLVTNNRFSRDDWRRERLDEGLLEVHVLGELPLWRRLRASLDVMRGRWRDNPLIETLAVKSLVVRSRRGRLWVALDGELAREPVPLHYAVKRSALKVLAPASRSAAQNAGTLVEPHTFSPGEHSADSKQEGERHELGSHRRQLEADQRQGAAAMGQADRRRP
jgi:diacylglycerol kinase family enzyme